MRRLCSLLFLAAFAAVGCDDTPLATDGGPIPTVLNADDDFGTLADVLDAVPEVRALLGEPGPYTLFAPTDDAFTYLGTTAHEALLDPGHRDLLAHVLRYHIVPGRLSADDLTDGTELTTLDGATVPVRREGETVLVGGAVVALDDLLDADNGVIVPIADVLRANLDLGSRLLLLPLIDDFLDYAGQTGTLDALDPDHEFTVLAPINGAFSQLDFGVLSQLVLPSNAALLKRVMDFHVLPGRYDFTTLASNTELTTLDGATVTFTREDGHLAIDGHDLISLPIEARDGTIYLLQSLLFDKLRLDQRLHISPSQTTFESHIRSYPDLYAHLQDDDGEYTVLGYTSAGYNTLDLYVRTVLAAPENAALFRRLVWYHVVSGRYASGDLVHGQVLTSIEGFPVRVSRIGSDLFIGDRLVVEADIEASNGLLYRMNSPALPPVDLFDHLLLGAFTKHVTAVRRAGLETFVRETHPLSMFAFTDEVYDRTPGLLDRPDLRQILEYHLAEDELHPLYHGQTFMPVYGPIRTITQGPTSFLLDDATPVSFLRYGTNGQLFIADDVAIPPSPR